MRELGKFTPKQPRSTCRIDWGETLFGDSEDGGGTSGLISHLFDQAAALTNTALLSDANPVNTAILTNTPISTPQYSIGTSNSMIAWVVAGLLVVGGFAFVAIPRR